jgi:hypothetical protein
MDNIMPLAGQNNPEELAKTLDAIMLLRKAYALERGKEFTAEEDHAVAGLYRVIAWSETQG